MTQIEKVLKHVKEHGSINVLEAMGLYLITQLGFVVHQTKQTRDALKSAPAYDMGNGFVRYIPDWEARQEAIENDFLNKLHVAEDNEARQVLAYQYAIDLSHLDIQKREHPKPKASLVELKSVA